MRNMLLWARSIDSMLGGPAAVVNGSLAFIWAIGGVQFMVEQGADFFYVTGALFFGLLFVAESAYLLLMPEISDRETPSRLSHVIVGAAKNIIWIVLGLLLVLGLSDEDWLGNIEYLNWFVVLTVWIIASNLPGLATGILFAPNICEKLAAARQKLKA